jgi:hypothetical protein
MNHTEIVDMALSYADREDDEITTRMGKFMLIVESRINKKLKVSDMSARAKIDLSTADPDQEIFAMPSDFGGLRSVKIVGAEQRVLTYVNPEQLSNRKGSGSSGLSYERIYYNIQAKELHLYPPQNTGDLEITYYQKVDPLTAANPNNWISDDEPECYIYGLLVEITSFAKDVNAVAIWEKRFLECIADIELDDAEKRWSGTPLQTHVG